MWSFVKHPPETKNVGKTTTLVTFDDGTVGTKPSLRRPGKSSTKNKTLTPWPCGSYTTRRTS